MESHQQFYGTYNEDSYNEGKNDEKELAIEKFKDAKKKHDFAMNNMRTLLKHRNMKNSSGRRLLLVIVFLIFWLIFCFPILISVWVNSKGGSPTTDNTSATIQHLKEQGEKMNAALEKLKKKIELEASIKQKEVEAQKK